MDFEQRTLPHILCCICGIHIPANPTNQCVNCVRAQVDITEGIPKQLTVQWCRGCGRYLQPPNTWLIAALESKELLTFCIKKIKGLNKVKLIDASFVWTEPHSKRLKVKLLVHKEIFNSAILSQVFIVEFIVQGQQCNKCQRVMTSDTWNAVVQARQKVDHKRTFYYLEQLILKHNAHANTINVRDQPDGLDFYFANRSHALKLLDFLQAVSPVKSKASEKLVSHDEHSNTYNYKYTFAVEISPVCRDDLVCLPGKMGNALGFSSPLVLVWKISSLIHVIEPLSLHVSEVSTSLFWNNPFRSLCVHKQLVEYTILDFELLGPTVGKFALADVTLARNSDFGSNDTQLSTRTHLGNFLRVGDTFLGYDLRGSNFNDADLTSMRGKDLPDVLLVRKVFPNNRKHNRRRVWTLKRLDAEPSDLPSKKLDAEKQSQEYEHFLRDLEEDTEMRSKVSLYKDPNAILERPESNQMVDEGEMDTDGENDPTFPEVGIEELLDDLTIVDNENDEEDDEEDEEAEQEI